MLTPYTLFFTQIIAFLSIFPMIYYGNAKHWLIAFFVYFITGCIGMTVTYHRALSHNSWSPPRLLEYFGVLCATLGLTGSAIAWVAIHRKHHRFADTEKDPHSPLYKKIIYCQWLTMFQPVELRYVTDLIKRPFYIFQNKYYLLINLSYAGFLFAIDPFSVIYAWLTPAFILWNAGSSIITISHLYGSNDHHLKSNAKNNWLLGLLVWGEGWHNNHHHSPSNKSFSESFWQIDIGGYCINVFEWLQNLNKK